MPGDRRNLSLLEATVADFLSRYPQVNELFLGQGFAVFPDECALHRGARSLELMRRSTSAESVPTFF